MSSRLRAALFATLIALISLWPARPPWAALIGDPLGETDNHLWMFWRAARQLGGHPGPFANAPVGVDIPLMDPINLPLFVLGWPFGPVIAWNGMILASVGLSMLGGYALARQFVDTEPALVAIAVAGSAPFLLGVIDFGITESWTIGWFGLHAALMIQYARTGDKRSAVGAGVTLGAIALSGWYHALLGLIMEAMLVPALLYRHRRVGTILQGLIGLTMITPSLLTFLEIRDRWRPRFLRPAPGPPEPRPDWAELPIYGTDLLNYIAPYPGSVHPSKSVYLGIIALALAGWGGLRRPRLAGPLVLMMVPFTLLGLGWWPTIAGTAIGVPGPAWWLATHIEALQGLSHWHRAIGGAIPFFAAAAAVGASALPKGRGVAMMLGVLIAVESAWLSQTMWPRTAYVPQAPEAITALPEGAGVIQIPFDNSREIFSQKPARLYQQWQVIHQRQISENYEGIDALLAQSALVAAIHSKCRNATQLPPYYQPPPEMRNPEPPTEPQAVREAVATLQGWGFGWIVLHLERCGSPFHPIVYLNEILGPGQQMANGDRVWRLDAEKQAP
ncbi:MAG: hypothetical protein AAFV53_08550 [Myxococcota bacterium]